MIDDCNARRQMEMPATIARRLDRDDQGEGVAADRLFRLQYLIGA